MTADEILAEVLVSPRRPVLSLPDLRMIERPDWMQLITPSLPQGGLNEVSLAILDERDVEATIDATIAEYRALGINFVWRVGPDSRPADLADRLARRGLALGISIGMARSTEIDGEQCQPIRIDAVDRANVDVFTRLLAEGWSMDPGQLARVHDAMLATPHHRLFVAFVDGQPAGVAGYVAFARSAYLLGGVVLPELRRRGVYGALVRARLADAAARGIALATTHARELTSAPILARMGFQPVCRVANLRG